MTILTLNVWGGRLRVPLLEFVAQRAATTDVFCLQEMTSATVPLTHPSPGDMVTDLAEQLAACLPDHQLILAPSREQFGELLAIAVRTTVTLEQQGFRKVVAAGTPGVFSSNGSFMQFAQLSNDDTNVVVAHLHGYWEKDDGEDKPPRDEQVRNILSFVDEQTYPVVLCGDLNMNRRSQGIARLGERLTNWIEHSDVSTTRPSWNPYHGTVGDYLFTSPGLTVRSFEVLPDEVSDHLALRVDLG